jgi:hypothetical protein
MYPCYFASFVRLVKNKSALNKGQQVVGETLFDHWSIRKYEMNHKCAHVNQFSSHAIILPFLSRVADDQ